MNTKEPPLWVTIIIVPTLLFIIFFIVGPIAVFLAVLLQRFVLCQAPPWDPDRYWDSTKGYALVGALIYIALIIATWNNQWDLHYMLERVIQEGLTLDIPALLYKWAAGLLLLPALALLQEHTQPRTDRALMRIITPAEQQILTKRDTKRQTRKATKQIEAREEPDTPLDPTKLDKRTFWERIPDDAPVKQIAREEQARNQFPKDEAQTMGHHPPATPKKQEKQDKGDGSMDELL